MSNPKPDSGKEKKPEPTEPTDQAIAQPQLETERLLLRPFCESDVEQVQQLLQCKEIAANTRSIEHPYPEGAAKIWIGTHVGLWEKGDASIFAICWQQEPQIVIGAVGLEINSSDENAELGYWIGQQWWSQGVCTEAAAEVVKYGFEHFGVKKIHAHHIARNPGSGRVMEKIGMEKEGYLKSHIKKWGVFEDVVFYGIVSTER